MAKQYLNKHALAKTFATIAAIGMSALWLAGNSGIYLIAFEQMAAWHVLFNLSFAGLVGGVIEAVVWSYIFGYAFGWLYNQYV